MDYRYDGVDGVAGADEKDVRYDGGRARDRLDERGIILEVYV